LIRVSQLSKQFVGVGKAAATTPALSDVSFEIGRGEIVGLLGPNGAGKTTMMRILTCFLAPTAGTAVLNGFAVGDDTLGVRRSVGYLPEAVPLYPDMRVSEYLGYRAALRGIPHAQRRAAIDAAIDQCALGDRRRQIIGTLSRGYRQRVGLADAVLARPPILILDEPTVGLDPNQIRETRQLIRNLGRETTILLSTHILPEVEAVASRVIILHRGRVIAAQTPAELRDRLSSRGRLLVEVRPEDAARAVEVFGHVTGVASVDLQPDGRLVVNAQAAGGDSDGAARVSDLREALFAAAVGGGLVLRELRADAASLEEIFTHITTDESGEAVHA
jgi:ABC-2 type transport system ATP-binding protein